MQQQEAAARAEEAAERRLEAELGVNPATSNSAAGDSPLKWLHLWAALGALYAIDAAVKVVFTSAAIRFPSALGGMFLVVATLMAVGEKNAAALSGAFSPALDWIARWLPLFYVPSLVTLPLALRGMPNGDLMKVVGILCVGTVATLLFTAQTATIIRNIVRTPVKEVPRVKPAPPFEQAHYAAWGAIAAVSAAVAVAAPAYASYAQVPFQMAATVGGFLLGNLVPKALQGVLHPVVVTSVIGNAGAALWGNMTGLAYDTSLKAYFAKGAGPLGAGDVLMAMLGMVIVSFGFRIYSQRDTMRRHAPEILGATLLSATFSMLSTAFAARAIGLSTMLARALIPRSVTVALALPIAAQLEAPLAITAAAVLLQGLLGANFGPNLMTLCGQRDTIARGLAAAATSGGLGTASLVSREPEALPFCALSYSMTGIISTVLVTIPQFRQLLWSIVG